MEGIQKIADRNKAVNLWTARVIPMVLAGVVGYATYVCIVLLCVNYLLVKSNDKGAAIPIIVIYFLLFIPMAASFFRVLYLTIFYPPYVPLGPAAIRDKEKKGKTASEDEGIGAGAYKPGNYRNDIDSPGLELFYSKDAFVCEQDGKPIWCSHCGNWKPDRAHHDSSSGRCIAKMDHFCPWVGGPVGETNFKFFVQFTFWTAVYCLHLLIVMAIYVHKQLTSEDEHLNRHFAAILGLAGFFCLFTGGMTATSADLLIANRTSVERLGAQTRIVNIAIKRPALKELSKINPYSAQNPSYSTITYPLEAGHAPNPQGWHSPAPIPSAECNANAHPISEAQEPAAAHASVKRSREVTTSDGTLPLSTSAPPNHHADGTRENRITREKVSARDLNATKTFAILSTSDPSDNPWNLGSWLLNWKSVMGNNVFDWLLPIYQSPCCNHEDPRSHFDFGPTVDRLRAQHSLIAAKDAPLRPKRKGLLYRFRRKDVEMANGERDGPRDRASGQKTNGHKSTPGLEDHIKMNDLNGNASPPLTA